MVLPSDAMVSQTSFSGLFFPSTFPNKPRPDRQCVILGEVTLLNPQNHAEVCVIVVLRVLGGGQHGEQKGTWGHRRDPGCACSAGTDHFKRDVQRGGKTDGGHKAQTRGGCASGMNA